MSGCLVDVIEIIAEKLSTDFDFVNPIIFCVIILLFWLSLYCFVCKKLDSRDIHEHKT